MSEPEILRDHNGRNVRIHGLVLNETNPAITLRELLRQWRESERYSPDGLKDLAERTDFCLHIIGTDGKKIEGT